MELARRLLATTTSHLAEVAKRSGFSSAALMNGSFPRELGLSPGAYRRRLR